MGTESICKQISTHEKSGKLQKFKKNREKREKLENFLKCR